MLVCGCCGTRWRYARTGCPFCETASHRLASIGIDDEHGLRIDYCASCQGYLKTYDGSGDEDVLLADWTSSTWTRSLAIAAYGVSRRRSTNWSPKRYEPATPS